MRLRSGKGRHKGVSLLLRICQGSYLCKLFEDLQVCSKSSKVS
jgi:hypothetical protein